MRRRNNSREEKTDKEVYWSDEPEEELTEELIEAVESGEPEAEEDEDDDFILL